MDNSALRPEVFNIPAYIKEEKVEDITDEEKLFANAADKPFWKALRKHFESSIQDLETINEAAIANGMQLEEIGRNALVISQVKGVLKKIINTVEDAREARDERGETK